MHLPGGVIVDEQRFQNFSFREVVGELELRLSESAGRSVSDRVTHALTASLAELGPQSADENAVRGLCTGDRQFLMRQLAAHIDNSPIWLTAICKQCDERFDVSYRNTDLPVKPAGIGYPWARVTTHAGDIRVRLPTGSDQELLAGLSDDDEAKRYLVGLLMDEESADFIDIDELDRQDLKDVESALEALSPELANALSTSCPDCGQEHKIALPSFPLSPIAPGRLLSEVHSIAMHYHWSERDILALSRSRRREYLRLIDASRGLHAGPETVSAH